MRLCSTFADRSSIRLFLWSNIDFFTVLVIAMIENHIQIYFFSCVSGFFVFLCCMTELLDLDHGNEIIKTLSHMSRLLNLAGWGALIFRPLFDLPNVKEVPQVP